MFSLLWVLALLRWCGWVCCVSVVVHSLFGLVTMLRFFSVLHIGIPLLAFRAGGGFLYPGGGGVDLFLGRGVCERLG